MSKKILFCATVLTHIRNFHKPYLKFFNENGYEVHAAAKKDCEDIEFTDIFYNIPFARSPFKAQNIRAYRQLKEIIDQNCYDIIHLHTPVASVLGRLAARSAREKGTRVIYTAHGFHFYKGAPFENWLLYYPVEKVMSRYCDCIITINEEDYNISTERKFKAGRIERVNGVGIDLNTFVPVDEKAKIILRQKKGYSRDDFLMIYPAALEINKNQAVLIRGMVDLKEAVPGIKLILCGLDTLNGNYQHLAKECGVFDCISFLGYREDINELVAMSDISVASSLREGLPRNIMEAMACGKPVVASVNRGHRELIEHDCNGYLFKPDDEHEFANYILKLYESKELRYRIGRLNVEKVKRYSIDVILKDMERVYARFMKYDKAGQD